VESGGYAQAAATIHRSQSTVSYAVRKLEQLAGVKAFEIQGRKAMLTTAGQVLYRRGKALIEEAARLERAATDLAKGWEPELRLAVDIVFPTWLLLRCFEKFSGERPETRIELIEAVLGGTDEALLEGRADFVIGSHVPAGFLGDPLMRLRFVCAAHPEHALHRLGRPLTLDDLRQHRHLVIRDSGVTRTRASGAWINELRWTVSHKATSIRAACMGLGYAWYPEESIREELDRGRLKLLPLVEGGVREATLYLVFADRETTGPGARRLAEILREQVAEICRTVERGEDIEAG
jgi:DNA-binding transcriptional LysR family regulator